MGTTNDGLSYWQAESGGEPLLETTVGDLLDRRADEIPTREAIVYSCYPEFGGALDIRWTYQEYRERANQVARGLMALGLNKGDHIAAWTVNLPEWILLQMGAAKAGLVLVTVNPAYRAQELEYVLKQGDVVFVDVYPLTASGKVQKFVLRQNAIKTLGLEEAAQIKTA